MYFKRRIALDTDWYMTGNMLQYKFVIIIRTTTRKNIKLWISFFGLEDKKKIIVKWL